MSNNKTMQFPNSIDIDKKRYDKINDRISEVEESLIKISENIGDKHLKLDDVSIELNDVIGRKKRVKDNLKLTKKNLDGILAEKNNLKFIKAGSVDNFESIDNQIKELEDMFEEWIQEQKRLDLELISVSNEEESLSKVKNNLLNEIQALQENALNLNGEVKKYNNEQKDLSKNIVDSVLLQNDAIQRQLESIEKQRMHEQSQLKNMNEKVYRRENEINKREKQLVENENKLSSSSDERLRDLQERELRLRDQEQAAADHMRDQRVKFDILRAKAQEEILELHNQAKKMDEEIALNKERQTKEYQEQLERNSAKYINNTLNTLEVSYKKAKSAASRWRFYGALSLVFACGALFYLSYSIDPLDASLEWRNISYLSIRGSAIFALAGAFATYSVKSSNRLSLEAAEIASRVHGIEYGAFFINTYGANARWEEINDAFRHWHKYDENENNKT